MALCNASLCSLPIASEPFDASSGVGVLAPLVGMGTQGDFEFRGEIFWATESQARFVARDSDGDELLGVVDKDPEEKVWYEAEFIDVLRGASIVSLTMSTFGTAVVLAQELVFNGEVYHSARVLVSGVALTETAQLIFKATCNDGSFRKRTLKIRGRTL